MQRFNTGHAMIVLCWSIQMLVSASGYSRSIVDFVNIYNGDYDNLQQVQEGFSDNLFSRARIVPVDIAILRPAAVLYVEWETGELLMTAICVISGGPGEVIRLTTYSLSDPRVHKYGEFIVSSLFGLKHEDLRENKCSGLIVRLRPDVFAGYFPDCSTTIQGHYPVFADTITCDVVSTIMPPTAGKYFSLTPYIFQRKGNSYPLVGMPETFDSFCGTTRCNRQPGH